MPDPDTHRQQVYEQSWRYIPDARTAVFARSDIEAGANLWMGNTELRVVPGADIPADTLTDQDSVTGTSATVDISVGHPITPDMLEPAE